MIKSFIALVATSALAVKVIQHFGRQQRLQRLRQERQHHEAVNRWEEEDGNLPDVDPALPAPVKLPPRPR